jgi:hypothetical protein
LSFLSALFGKHWPATSQDRKMPFTLAASGKVIGARRFHHCHMGEESRGKANASGKAAPLAALSTKPGMHARSVEILVSD